MRNRDVFALVPTHSTRSIKRRFSIWLCASLALVVVPAHAQTLDTQPICELPGAYDTIAFSPDARALAMGDQSGNVVVVRFGERHVPLRTDSVSAVRALKFSRDGSRLLIATHSQILVATSDNLALLRVVDIKEAYQVVVSDDLQTAVTAFVELKYNYVIGLLGLLITGSEFGAYAGSSDRFVVTSIDMSSGRRRRLLKEKNTDGVVALSADAGRLAVLLTDKPRSGVLIWNRLDGKPTRSSSLLLCCGAFALHPSGKSVVSFNPKRLALLAIDLVSGQQIRQFELPSGGVGTLVFSVDGSMLAGQGADKIFVWNFDTGKLLQTIQSKPLYGGKRIAFAHDGSLLAVANGTSVSIYRVPATQIPMGNEPSHP